MKKPLLIINDTKNVSHLENSILNKFPNAKNEKHPDVIITLGGDGTLMHAIRDYGYLDIPFFPIAGGTLNFIPNKVDETFFDNIKYEVEETFFLEVEINNEKHNVVNDVVFGNGIMDYFHFEIKAMNEIDDFKKFHTSAGGLCIATPLGSTAFSLNNGAPVLTSLQSEFVLLSSVVGNKNILRKLNVNKEIRISVSGRDKCFIFLDGKAKIIEVTDEVIIRRGERVRFFFTDLRAFELKRLGV